MSQTQQIIYIQNLLGSSINWAKKDKQPKIGTIDKRDEQVRTGNQKHK